MKVEFEMLHPLRLFEAKIVYRKAGLRAGTAVFAIHLRTVTIAGKKRNHCICCILSKHLFKPHMVEVMQFNTHLLFSRPRRKIRDNGPD